MPISNFSGPLDSGNGLLIAGADWSPGGETLRTGFYFSAPISAVGQAALTNGDARYTGLYVNRRVRIDRLSINMTAQGADAGASIRFGIYNDTGQNRPVQLLLDAGTVAAGSGTTPSVREVVVNFLLYAGLYWLVAVGQGIAGTGPTVDVINGGPAPLTGGVTGLNSANTGWDQTGVTGALPLLAGPLSASAGNARTHVRIG